MKGNTQLREWLRGNPIALSLLMQGKTRDALNGMGGIDNWWQWDEFFQTETGSVNPTKTANYFIPDEDAAIMLPATDRLMDYLGWAEAMTLNTAGRDDANVIFERGILPIASVWIQNW